MDKDSQNMNKLMKAESCKLEADKATPSAVVCDTDEHRLTKTDQRPHVPRNFVANLRKFSYYESQNITYV